MPIANLGSIKGPKGDRGNVGAQGLPGVLAESNDAATADLILTDGTSQTQDSLDSRYATGARPVWAPTAGTWDARRSVFNGHPGNRARLDAALARSRAGVGSLHVSTFIDSITHDAGDSRPSYQASWPGFLAKALARDFGDGGTGIVVPWNDYGLSGSPAAEPRLNFHSGAGGSIDRPYMGLYEAGSLRITNSSGANNYLEFTTPCNDFYIYSAETGARLSIAIDGGPTLSLARDITDTTADISALAGYAHHSGGAGGQVVHRIPVASGTPASHTIRILGAPGVVLGVEGRNEATGARVSNLALSGQSLERLFVNDNGLHGGTAVAFDMPRADLAVLMCPMNDWQAHRPVADVITQLGQAIDAQRAFGAASNGGTHAFGDVLLVLPPQPDYAVIPPDHVNTPMLTDYFTAIYELAITKDVAVLDVAQAWRGYDERNDFFKDSIHPNALGAADISARVYAYVVNN